MEMKSREFPSWSNGLCNRRVHELCLIGTSSSEKGVYDVIDAYSRSLPCDFVRSHTSKSHAKHDIKSEKVRLLWQLKDISFDGVPFTVVGQRWMKCSFGMKYKNVRHRKKILKNSQNSVDDKANLNSTFGKCPAFIIIKHIKRFPSNAVSLNSSKSAKMSVLRSVKEQIASNPSMFTETIFWVKIPLRTQHNHEFSGKNRLVNPLIREKLREILHQNNVKSIDDIKITLSNYVQQFFISNDNPPFENDTAFYPSRQTISNLIYNYRGGRARKNDRIIPSNDNFNSSKSTGAKNLNSIPFLDEIKKIPSTLQETSSRIPSNNNFNSSKSINAKDSIRFLDESKKVPTTLQEAVDEFCAESIEDYPISGPNDLNSKISNTSVSNIKQKITRQILNLNSVVNSLDDPFILTKIYEFLSCCPLINNQPSLDSSSINAVHELNTPINVDCSSQVVGHNITDSGGVIGRPMNIHSIPNSSLFSLPSYHS